MTNASDTQRQPGTALANGETAALDKDYVRVGRVVSLRYRIVDGNGKHIEDNLAEPEPYTFVQGTPRVIRGLQMLIEGRRVGETLRGSVPPERAYAMHRKTIEIPAATANAHGPLAIGELVDVEVSGQCLEAEVCEINEGHARVRTTGRGHPLEHTTLRYEELTIVAVRDASGEELDREGLRFPFDMFAVPTLPGPVGATLTSLAHLCLFPPYPWGQWLYARLFERLCKDLPGDVAELGVARGGMSIFLGTLAKPAQKRLFSFDSFEGLPPPNLTQDNAYFREGDYGPQHGDLLERFEAEIARFSLADTITPVKGFFEATLGSYPKNRYCFVHLDSDLYDSIMVSLRHVWERTTEGGVVVIDDFFHPAMGPRKAAADFFRAIGEDVVYHVSFPYTVFVIKGERPLARTRSVDGLVYSLEWLRSDPDFVAAARRSAAQMEPALSPRAADNARAFAALLSETTHRSSDIYEYWRVLEDFWDAMDIRPGSAAAKLVTRV
jgi:FKBP-type peptidyl-prolyl cis-trans isomerase 2